MRLTIVVGILAMLGLGACQTTGAGVMGDDKKWTGVIALEESAEVWQIYDQTVARGNGTDWTAFTQQLEAGLDDGTIRPATGDFDFIPYANGQPADEPYTVTVRPQDNGTWYFMGPAEFFQPGRAMCVEVPESWVTIAGLSRFPAAANPRTNCYDFGPEAGVSTFADSQYNAATIVVVKPAPSAGDTVPPVATGTPTSPTLPVVPLLQWSTPGNQVSMVQSVSAAGARVVTPDVTYPVTLGTQQTRIFANGSVDANGILHWSNGGGDPLQSHLRADGFRATLALPRLNLSPDLQDTIRQVVMHQTPERIDLSMYKGQQIDGVMVSGDGWLATGFVVETDSWTRQNFEASTWFITHTNSDGTIERWQIILAGVCGNLILIPRGGPLPCICIPEEDVCSDLMA